MQAAATGDQCFLSAADRAADPIMERCGERVVCKGRSGENRWINHTADLMWRAERKLGRCLQRHRDISVSITMVTVSSTAEPNR